MLVFANDTTQQHQLEVELWLKELSFLNEEIEIMKHHLSDLYYRDNSESLMNRIEHFNETFDLQQEWLRKVKEDLENMALEEEWSELTSAVTGKKSFYLQMQANRMINQELKDSFLKLFS